MTEILYCQSPALFLLAVVLLICFLLRRQAHRVRAALDLVLCILLLIGGVVLYYLGIYSDCFTIHDFWQIRTSGWVGLGVVTAGSVWHLCKVCKQGVERRRTKGPPDRRRRPTVRRWRAPAGRRMKPERPTPPRSVSRPPPPRRHPPFPSPQRTSPPARPIPPPRSVQPLPPLTHRSPPPEEQVKPCKNPDTKPMTLWLQCLPNTVQPR